MAVTAIVIIKDGLARRSQFMTLPNDTHLDVDIYMCDEKFIPAGRPLQGVDERSEEDYHRELRKEAKAAGQFDADHSTNPEWNPE